MFTARRLAHGALILIHASSHAAFDPLGIGRHELTDSFKTAVCELRLAVQRVDQTNAALAALRDFRVRLLNVPIIDPGYSPRLHASSPTRDTARLAAHVRGIESWTDHADDHRSAGYVMLGGSQVVSYGTLQGIARRDVDAVQRQFAEHDPRTMPICFLRGFALGAPIFPLFVHGLMGFVPCLAIDPASHAWRFVRDTQRDRTQRAIDDFFAGEPGADDWVFSSRSYAVSRRTIEAVWSGDAEQLRASLQDDLYETSWWLNRYALMPGADVARGVPLGEALGARLNGTVIVDQLARLHPRDGVPMLVTLVRTTSRRWAKIPRASASPARDGALVPSAAH